MGKYILAHDLGTTGNKATLYNSDGKLINSKFFGYETSYPKTNWAEQNPDDWWRAVCKSTNKLIKDSKIDKSSIGVVGFSGQMMGALPVNEKGQPLSNSIIWADQRSTEEANLLSEKIGNDRVYNITGHRISPAYSGEKILWFKNNKPEIYANTFKFLQAKDYIIYKLTGEFVTDYSDATGMNIFDINKLKWSEKIIELAGIDIDKLPKALPSTHIAGTVKSSVAEIVGLQAGTPVVIGAGDGTTATVGAGIIEEGEAYNVVGSSSWIALSTSEPIFDEEKKTFNWAHAVPGMYVPCGTMQAAGASYSWARDNLSPLEKIIGEKLEIDEYELMNLLIEKSPPGANNLLYLPYLMGERSPHWDPEAKGAFVGLNINNDRSDMLRAVLEGVTFNLRIILESFTKKISLDSIKVIGGGAKGKIWRQIMADIYNKNILRLELLDEASSLGGAIIGGVGVGIFDDFSIAKKLNPVVDEVSPNQKNIRLYNDLLPVFKEAYHSLKSVNHKLSKLD
ncbi:MAG: xylulokinase [bacterium]